MMMTALSPSPWWPGILQRSRQPHDLQRIGMRIDGHLAGSIARPLLTDMLQAGLPFAKGADGASVALVGDPDTALRAIAAWLRDRGHAGRWRNERLAVRAGGSGPTLAVVERGVARNLGIHTSAVQLHARDPDSGHWWLQQRALDKATDPGQWDTVTGGMVAAGETVPQALARECWEEAGVRLDDLAQAPADAGMFTIGRPVRDSGSHGFMVEDLHAFSCTLARGQVPANQDGEVLRFEAFSDARIDGLILAGRLTLEAALAVGLCRGLTA